MRLKKKHDTTRVNQSDIQHPAVSAGKTRAQGIEKQVWLQAFACFKTGEYCLNGGRCAEV